MQNLIIKFSFFLCLIQFAQLIMHTTNPNGLHKKTQIIQSVGLSTLSTLVGKSSHLRPRYLNEMITKAHPN